MMPGIYALAMLFRCTLDMVHAEWSSLPNCPRGSRERESFLRTMSGLCRESHLRPELTDSPHLFGNFWTI